MASAALQLPNPALETPVLYKVKPGDSVSRIMKAYYGAPYDTPRYQTAVQFLKLYNPQIHDLDKIRAGQMLRLMPLEARDGLSYCPAPAEYLAQLNPKEEPLKVPYDLRPGPDMLERYRVDWPISPDEESAFWALATLQENYNWLAIPGGTAFSSLGYITGHGNNALLQQVKRLYEDYKRGIITKGQYDAGRRRVLKQYAQLVGPFEKFLMGGKTTPEAIRISRLRGLPATHRIESQLHNLNRLSKLATKGGVILTAAGVYTGCKSISNAKSQHEKNEILVETATSTLVSGISSIAIGMILLSNPVGWGVAIALSAGSAVASLGAGELFRHAYNKYGEGVDLLSVSGIDRVCG